MSVVIGNSPAEKAYAKVAQAAAAAERKLEAGKAKQEYSGKHRAK